MCLTLSDEWMGVWVGYMEGMGGRVLKLHVLNVNHTREVDNSVSKIMECGHSFRVGAK